MRIESADGGCVGVMTVEAQVAPLLACIPGGGCNGRYFSEARPSTAALAQAAGFSVLLVDRPGYGASPAIEGSRPIAHSLPMIASLLERAVAAADARDLVLIGHSIGGAVALTLAAEPGALPLRAVAVAGIGDEAPAATRRWAATYSPTQRVPDFSADAFFARPGSYDWRGPATLRRATEPWQMSEVVEIVRRWPERWPSLAPRIALPVHLRLADADAIWVTGQMVVDRMADRLTAARRVDAALLPDGGHAYEYHRRGEELVVAQLAFLARAIRGR